jgi:hypothetical protein
MHVDEVDKLKQAWQVSGLFVDEQAYLAARVRSGLARYTFLDPAETWGSWLMVVVRFPTGVIYGTQCAGVATEQRYVEGYLVPLGGLQCVPENGSILSAPLRAVFHRGKSCMWGWAGLELPTDRRATLDTLIEAIPYWQHTSDEDIQSRLCVDQERASQIAEAWIPVQTPDGPGVLLFNNCD